MSSRLELHSERFSANGNLVAEGIEKLLGSPSLDLLTVLVREATQNACDATLPGSTCTLKWRLRRLDAHHVATLRESIFCTLPEEPSARRKIEDFLSQPDRQWVLEICDFGTTGLQGPTRADETEGVENPDFVNFFRNLGAPRDVEQGGGTYGYGKSTLYRASRCHAIVVDTLTLNPDGQEERRIMAAQLGKSVQGRYTGRHWWGVPLQAEEGVDPLRGMEAEALSRAIGLPSRTAGQRGTSIMILDPVFLDLDNLDPDNLADLQEKILREYSLEDLVTDAICENLLWFFWPRMLKDTAPGRKLVCEIWKHDTFEPVGQPEELAPFHLFARALKLARQGEAAPVGEEGEVEPIESQKPRQRLGYLAIARGQWKARKLFLPASLSKEDLERMGVPPRIPEKCHHVALMRPVEMVVKYLEGEESDVPEREWAGVFRVSDDEEVEQAFADAEPPAHDDWRPDSLSERRQKTFVNVALRRIKAKLHPEKMELSGDEGESHPLGRLADELGRFLDLDNAPGPSADRSSPGGGGSGRKPFTQPRFAGLLDIDGKPVARFVFNVHAAVHAEADIRVMVDGKADEPDEVVGQPEILEWVEAGGMEMHQGDQVDLVPGKWEIRIIMPEQAAVKVRLKEAE